MLQFSERCIRVEETKLLRGSFSVQAFSGSWCYFIADFVRGDPPVSDETLRPFLFLFLSESTMVKSARIGRKSNDASHQIHLTSFAPVN